MTYDLRLVGGFRLSDSSGSPLFVRRPTSRLLSLLGLSGRRQMRSLVSAHLWPDLPDRRALANLRSVYWRTRKELPGILNGDADSVWIPDEVEIDYLNAITYGPARHLDAFMMDLLPDISEPWCVVPRLVFRQMRLQMLEDYAQVVMRRSPTEALAILEQLSNCEPYRESTLRLTVACLVASGSVTDANEICEAFRSRLKAERSIDASGDLMPGVAPLRPGEKRMFA
jgi:DNA-binding SARP family transcriptional activator